eukprot:6322481-Alexandrium_andersonii.AAC.1
MDTVYVYVYQEGTPRKQIRRRACGGGGGGSGPVARACRSACLPHKTFALVTVCHVARLCPIPSSVKLRLPSGTIARVLEAWVSVRSMQAARGGELRARSE